MAKFKLAALKTKSAEELANIRDYGHPSYNFFGSVVSDCKRFEMIVEVSPTSLNTRTGKYSYALELQLFKYADGIDPDSDDALEGGELISSVDRRVCRTKAEIWQEIAELAQDAE